MGQKVNPIGFRIGTTKGWNSVWYMPKEKYSETVLNDYRIREFVRRELKPAGVEKVEIKRYLNKVEIVIHVARPGVVIGRAGSQIELIREKINKMAGSKIDLKVIEVKDPEISAQLIADRICEQLERRVTPKFVMAKELEKAVETRKIKGIRIWVSGRIKGAEIARIEKMQWGSIPLQTLSIDINYAVNEAQVPNAGKQGIKVWVYRNIDTK